MIASAIGYAAIKTTTSLAFPESLFVLVAWTTVWWLVVTWLTPPESEAHLVAFYLGQDLKAQVWAR